MKPNFVKVVSPPSSSIFIDHVIRKERRLMKGAWHFHTEYEICLTLSSHGKRFVGHDISDYQPGDLVLLGSNLPHCWLTNQKIEQYAIHFKKEAFGKGFFNIPELQLVKNLLEGSEKGIVFQAKTKEKVKKMILELVQLEGYEQLVQFLNILHYLALSKDYYHLDNQGYITKMTTTQSARIEHLFTFLLNNFKRDPSLEESADVLNMTKTSFCRFIKKTVKKTYSEILNEIKIAHACKLLIETDKNITQICYESGFNDVSHFYRRFKFIMHKNPKEFRNNYLENGAEITF